MVLWVGGRGLVGCGMATRGMKFSRISFCEHRVSKGRWVCGVGLYGLGC